MSLRRASEPGKPVDGAAVNPDRRTDRTVAKPAGGSSSVGIPKAFPSKTELSADPQTSSMFPAEYWAGTDTPASPAATEAVDEKPKRNRKKKIEDLPREEQLEKAKETALYSLSASAKTRGQLEEKLLGKGYPEDVVAEALDRLTEVGLIDDEAYARAFVSSRHEVRGLAASAIRRELQRKGVDKEIADEAVTVIDSEDEWKRAYELAARKAKSTQRLDKDTRVRRLVSMLARKGYSGGIAYAVVKQVLADEGTALDTHLDSGEE